MGANGALGAIKLLCRAAKDRARKGRQLDGRLLAARGGFAAPPALRVPGGGRGHAFLAVAGRYFACDEELETIRRRFQDLPAPAGEGAAGRGVVEGAKDATRPEAPVPRGAAPAGLAIIEPSVRGVDLAPGDAVAVMAIERLADDRLSDGLLGKVWRERERRPREDGCGHQEGEAHRAGFRRFHPHPRQGDASSRVLPIGRRHDKS